MLHYDVLSNDKSKQWLFLLHGLGGNSNIWYKQIDSFKDKFNIVLVDFRGHGKSAFYEPHVLVYTPKLMCDDIVKIMNFLSIEKAHFMAISLGTIILVNLSIYYPDRIESMILAGAALQFNLLGHFLLSVGKLLSRILPHGSLYKLFAHIILPHRHHKKSRDIFIREARLLCRKEFLKWFDFITKLHLHTKDYITSHTNKIPTLFVMGDQDYMFLSRVKKVISNNNLSNLHIIKQCGHVCNIEKWREFNHITMDFYKTLQLNV